MAEVVQMPARIVPASDALPLTFPYSQSLALVWSFASRWWLHRPRYPATTTSTDFSLRHIRRPFRREARSPRVRDTYLHHTAAASTLPCLGHESFAVPGPLALLGTAFLYAVLVHRLVIYVPRFLPTLGRPHAVALHFVRRDQLTAGLAPAGMRPCRAHQKCAGCSGHFLCV